MSSIKNLLHKLRIINVDATIKEEVFYNNTSRVFAAALVAVIIHLFFILYIICVRRLMTNHTYWITCIICHSTMLCVMAGVGVVLLHSRYKHKKVNRAVSKLFYIITILYLCMGAAITLTSNLMYSNVSAYVILCLGTAVFFTPNPIVATIYNFIIYVVFAYLMQYFQNDKLLLINNRNNCFAAVIISVFVSFIIWQYNVRLIEQKKIIEKQNTALKEKNKINEYLATHDELTGIFNRAYFHHLSSIEIKRLGQLKGEMCLIIADIDYFKNINDRFGHPIGDGILKEFSELLSKNTRKSDIVARLGGEEFVVLMPEMSVEEAIEKTELLRRKIETYQFSSIPEHEQITASFGVVSIDSLGENPLSIGYKNADNALYKAKQQGRNRVVVYEDGRVPIQLAHNLGL